MKFRHEMPYDASPAQVYAMLADPAFREQVGVNQDVVSSEVQITPTKTGMSVRIDQVQHTAGIPSFAKRFLGATTRALQLEEWTDHRSASLEIKAPTPGTVKGSISIESAGKKAVEIVELDIATGIPLIGGKLESLLGDLIRKAIVTEHRTGIAWLGGETA